MARGSKQREAVVHPSRLLMRAGQEYMLHSLVLIGRHFNGDFTRGAIYLAINSASTGYLMDDPDLKSAFATEEYDVPSELRRPISRLAISNILGIPFETVRRHCKALIADGWCVEMGRGLITAKLTGPEFALTRAQNVAHLRRLLRRLEGVGLRHVSNRRQDVEG
jgi:hypothetical protein